MAKPSISPFEKTITQKESKPRTARKNRQIPPDPTSGTLERTLRDIFSISQLRPGQQEVIESILNGHDTLAIMPTGAGKSLCYQLPAVRMPGVTLVVSPLISLMKDQADKLEDVGIDTIEVNSTLSSREKTAAMQGIEDANNEFIFTTPERLSDPEFNAFLKRKKIDLVVIDEAHCISQWGHDFRPAFLALGTAINALDRPVVLALTATATEPVIKDIAKQLDIPDMRVINTGIYRPNLHYRVIQITNEEEKRLEILRLVQQTPGHGIIYAATVKAVDELYQALRQAGEQVTFYHGQLGSKERTRRQEDFMQGNCRVMVATNAFGMGIDKHDIRFVIHYQMPANLETYYQESGRAGRDGAPAWCTLLYYAKDKRVQEFFLARRYPGAHEIIAVYAALQSLSAISAHMTLAQLRSALKSISIVKLQAALNLLAEGGFILQDSHFNYRLLKKDAGKKALTRLAGKYEERNRHDREALKRMVFYAQTGFCRWKVLLEYFGEKVEWTHCGTCDNCVRSPESLLTAERRIQHAPPVRKQKEAPWLKVGSPAKVPKFGEGRIVSIAGDKITIVFPNSQTRVFMRDYVEPL